MSSGHDDDVSTLEFVQKQSRKTSYT